MPGELHAREDILRTRTGIPQPGRGIQMKKESGPGFRSVGGSRDSRSMSGGVPIKKHHFLGSFLGSSYRKFS